MSNTKQTIKQQSELTTKTRTKQHKHNTITTQTYENNKNQQLAKETFTKIYTKTKHHCTNNKNRQALLV